MEGGVKAEVNGTPLPQRNPKNQQNQNQNQQNQNQGGGKMGDEDGVPEKKPRFGGGGGGGGGGQFGGGPGGNQGRGGMNNRDGNRGRNNRFPRGGGGGGGRNQGGGGRQDGDNKGGPGDGGMGGDNQGGGGGGGGGGGRDGGGRDGGGNQDRRNRDRNDDRRGGGGMGGGMGGMGGDRRRGEEFGIMGKLKQIQGPTHELPPIDAEETKFSGRNRLYIGNLTNDISEEELKEMFKPYGEINEVFLNAEKNFAFLKVDYHANAERAKRELDGINRKNRALRVRFAPNATIVRVKNLEPFVSNELLFKAFEVFGNVERAVIIVDDRGKSTGEGIVEFARKQGAMAALRFCSEKCYFLTASLRPCVAEPYELNDDADGLPEKSLNKKSQEFFKARSVGPRCADPGSFEHEYGTRWKQLHELFKQKHAALKRELELEEEKLEAQMEYARYEHETELLREQLRQREQDRERQKMEWELKERQRDEQRMREEEALRRRQEDMQLRMSQQDEEIRRRQQENTLFMQAQQLNSLLDQQELNQGNDMNNGGNRNNFGGNINRNFGGGGGGDNLGPGNAEQGFMPFDIGLNDKPQFDNANQGGGGGGPNQRVGGGGGANRQWNNDNRGRPGGNDFQNNKRRRF